MGKSLNGKELGLSLIHILHLELPEQIWWQHSRRKKFSRLLQRFLSEESENRKMWQMHASFSQVNLQVMCQEKF